MPTTGDTVTVHYTGKLDDGTEFDSSRGGDPLSFELGAGQIIPGFETAVRDMSVGDQATVRLEPTDAYGMPDPDLVMKVPSDNAPDGLAAGDRVMLGNGAQAVVLETDAETVTIDANHPLAGHALTFEIELVGIT